MQIYQVLYKNIVFVMIFFDENCDSLGQRAVTWCASLSM